MKRLWLSSNKSSKKGAIVVAPTHKWWSSSVRAYNCQWSPARIWWSCRKSTTFLRHAFRHYAFLYMVILNYTRGIKEAGSVSEFVRLSTQPIDSASGWLNLMDVPDITDLFAYWCHRCIYYEDETICRLLLSLVSLQARPSSYYWGGLYIFWCLTWTKRDNLLAYRNVGRKWWVAVWGTGARCCFLASVHNNCCEVIKYVDDTPIYSLSYVSLNAMITFFNGKINHNAQNIYRLWLRTRKTILNTVWTHADQVDGRSYPFLCLKLAQLSWGHPVYNITCTLLVARNRKVRLKWRILDPW